MNLKINDMSIDDNGPVRLMAAINLSPESFFSGSVIDHKDEKAIENKFRLLLEHGTEIFDLGPRSTAPISIYGKETFISPEKEIERISLPLKILHDLDKNLVISIDTQSSKVAEYSLSHGATIINDISGLKIDKQLAKVIGNHNGALIAMACQTNPGDVYTNHEVLQELKKSIQIAENASIKKVIIDPGIGGWVKSRSHQDDFKLITAVPEFKKKLERPVLLGLSRKSFIGKTLNLEPKDRLFGSLSATAIAVLYGANIIRTHDVKETREAIKIAEEFKKIRKFY